MEGRGGEGRGFGGCEWMWRGSGHDMGSTMYGALEHGRSTVWGHGPWVCEMMRWMGKWMDGWADGDAGLEKGNSTEQAR